MKDFEQIIIKELRSRERVRKFKLLELIEEYQKNSIQSMIITITKEELAVYDRVIKLNINDLTVKNICLLSGLSSEKVWELIDDYEKIEDKYKIY